MWNYERIKQEAKAAKRKVESYLVLSPQRDPFYVGSPGQISAAEWLYACYQALGYDQPGVQVHIRRMHYAIVSRTESLPVPPNGKPYENTEQCWDYLQMAAQAARYLGLVPFEAIVDNRNTPPACYVVPTKEPTLETVRYELFEPLLPGYRLADYTALQPYHLELWCEKSTQDDILLPLAQRYQINMQSGAGEASITNVRDLALRIKASGKPAAIFYLSDFDTGGQSMPVAYGRKLQKFVELEDIKQDVKLIPLVLSYEQACAYDLPRTPLKAGDKRAAGFEARYGKGGTELDALEALYPGELERIVREAIESYYDMTLEQRTSEAEQYIQRQLDQARAYVFANHQEEIERLQREYYAVQRAFDALSQTLALELQAAAPDFDPANRPQAQPAREIGNALYHSARSYEAQVAVFKQFQGKDQQMEGAA